MHKYLYFLLLFFLSLPSFAQNSAVLKGSVKDSITHEAVVGAVVALSQNGTLLTAVMTDVEGDYYLSGVSSGDYLLEVSFMGYATQKQMVRLKTGDINYVHFRMGRGEIVFDPHVFTEGPTIDTIIDIPPTVSVVTIDQRFLLTMPARDDAQRIGSLPGTAINGRQISVKASRPSATGFYLGTMPLIARLNFSSGALSQMGLVLGGVSPEYGDFIGGAVVQHLTAASTRPRVSAEVITSSIFDKYHYNQLDLNLSGPLIKKDVAGGEYKRMVLGYHMNFNLLYQADPSPSGIGVWRVKPDKLKELENSPIRRSVTGSGFRPSAEFLTMQDLEKVSARDNASANDFMWLGKLDYRPYTNLSVEAAAIVDRQRAYLAPFGNNLLNSSANPISTNWVLISYLNMEHNLLARMDTSNSRNKNIKRMKYSISLQYQSVWNRVEDPVLKDDYFKYGHVGRFNGYRAPVYQYKGGDGPAGRSIPVIKDGDTVWVKNYYELTGFADTAFTFDRSNSSNPLLANYTSAFYDEVDHVENIGEVSSSGGALLNGQNPIGIYSNMWNNIGALSVGSSINSGVGRSQTEQFSINVNGELTKGMHTMKVGLYFEQRVSRGYSVNAMNLWNLMYQSANQGLTLDLANPILHYDGNGNFSDSVSYKEVFNDKKTQFGQRLREELIKQGYRDAYGKEITPESYVNTHSLSPDMLNLDYFTADELLGTGGNNQYVSYFGYDYLGKKDRKNHDLSDFLDDPSRRSIGAFRPIYAAAYAQDMIELRNMIIRFGVRVERFDANVPVLKDPYSLYPIRQAGEVKTLGGKPVVHPDGIESDFAVYVDDVSSPKNILGYRDGHNWYNRDGQRLNDPTSLATKSTSGTIQPYLVNAKEQRLNASSFRDFNPQTLVLPRFAVDFPISSEARLFAYYDVLAQRPSNIFTPIDDYYFLQHNASKVLNNPDLKPQITTDYEIGFKQLITRSSSLSLVASYREQRNMIQLVRYYQAYPVSYISYGNIDLSTVKGVRVEYSLRSANLFLDGSYMFQVADGTGSGTNSQAGLVSAGYPNLRNLFPLEFDIRHNIKLNMSYEFGERKTYRGPIIKGKKVLQNGGVSLMLNAFSGQPYTATAFANPDAQAGIAGRTVLKGTPNGSRLPWQLNNNISVYKAFPVVLGKRDGLPIEGHFTFTLWVENFLNVQNVRAVHSFSGSAGTDGYLNSPNGRQVAENSTNSQSFIDLYNVALANPGFYSLPRRTRLSLLLTF